MCLPVHPVVEEVVAAEHQDAPHAETEREKHLARCVDPQLGGEKKLRFCVEYSFREEGWKDDDDDVTADADNDP